MASATMTSSISSISSQDSYVMLNVALAPPIDRYKLKPQNLLSKMKPLKDVPTVLIPSTIDPLKRRPPLLRQGFPITTSIWSEYLPRFNSKKIPIAGELAQAPAVLLLEAAISRKLSWPVQLHRVYGLNTPYEIIAQTRNNYEPEDMPEEIEQELRSVLHLNPSEPMYWYLDHDRCYWDWEDWES